MSHQEKIARINAELNTTAVWERRWQIEREHNERLAGEAEKVRTGIHILKAGAIQRYTNNRQHSLTQSGMVRAFDDVLELMDAVSRQP